MAVEGYHQEANFEMGEFKQLSSIQSPELPQQNNQPNKLVILLTETEPIVKTNQSATENVSSVYHELDDLNLSTIKADEPEQQELPELTSNQQDL